MAKATTAARRLKVYRARLGFDDSVVAAPNQGDALAAWGVRQNLFAEGQAVVETDPEIVAAALVRPGTPLRRPVGASDGFGLEARAPVSLPPVRLRLRRRLCLGAGARGGGPARRPGAGSPRLAATTNAPAAETLSFVH